MSSFFKLQKIKIFTLSRALISYKLCFRKLNQLLFMKFCNIMQLCFSFHAVRRRFMMSLSEDLNLVLDQLREAGRISSHTFRQWSRMLGEGLHSFVRAQGIYWLNFAPLSNFTDITNRSKFDAIFLKYHLPNLIVL